MTASATLLLFLAVGAAPAPATPPAAKPAAAAAAAKAPAAAAPQKAASGPNKFKLKPGAAGQLCLECHGGEFQDVLAKKVLHTPVREKNCAGCHNPHAATHGKLLDASAGESCKRCHDVVPKEAKSLHKPISGEKGCVACHDPHGTDARFVLLKPGNELCASCHSKIADAANKAKFKHAPVVSDCNKCHQPHGSAKGPSLLADAVPALCTNCHKPTSANFATRHRNYDVAKANCVSCHDPHGSDSRALLHGKAHAPLAKGNCAQCHEAAGTPNQFKTKQAGAALCKSCHAQKMNTLFDKARQHRPVADGDCLACHNPHASRHAGLLKGDMNQVCGDCHQDTIDRQARSKVKHEPIKNGECTSCHDPHASDTALLFVKADNLEVCGKCHDWHRHSSHPIGPDRVDPRNANLRLDCLSCHRAHGTEFKNMFPYATTSDLCTKCHAKFTR